MAASAMMLLPWMSTLFTVNLDYDIRAHQGAQTATRTGLTFGIDCYGTITPGIECGGGRDMSLGTDVDTEMTFFAELFSDSDFTLLALQFYLSLNLTGVP